MIRSEKDRGFSLIELIVVIAIMVVMLGIIGYSLGMLLGAEARQGARKMDAQLNDIKTGAMSRAAEYMLVGYIDLDDDGDGKVSKAEQNSWAAVGVDKPGYYAVKSIATIDNATDILKAVEGVEYNRIGSSKVTIALGNGDTLAVDDNSAFKIEYKRSTGELEKILVGTMSVTSDGKSSSFSEDHSVDITETTDSMTFTSGMRTYTITFTEGTGKHTLQ